MLTLNVYLKNTNMKATKKLNTSLQNRGLDKFNVTNSTESLNSVFLLLYKILCFSLTHTHNLPDVLPTI